MPKIPHYRISSYQIAPISLDSGLPSTSPPPRRAHGQRSRGGATLPTRASTKRAHMHHGTSRGKPKGIPRAGSAMTRGRGSAMTHHDLIRMTVDSRVLGHPQSRQINPNRGPSRAPTGLNPPPSPGTPLYWERRLISCFCFASHVDRLFRWAPGTRSALTVQGLTRPVRERRSQGEGRTPRTVSTRPTPRSAAPGLLTRTPPTRCAFR